MPGNVTNKNSWGPNTLIKQGAKLVATWEDVWEELPQDVRLALTPETGDESQAGQTASLFEEPALSPHEKKIYAVLKADEAPKSYQELLAPKWKAKLCWAASAETGGALMFITFIRRVFSDEKGEAYLRELSKQQATKPIER